jgi:hypothetical protein
MIYQYLVTPKTRGDGIPAPDMPCKIRLRTSTHNSVDAASMTMQAVRLKSPNVHASLLQPRLSAIQPIIAIVGVSNSHLNFWIERLWAQQRLTSSYKRDSAENSQECRCPSLYFWKKSVGELCSAESGVRNRTDLPPLAGT